ncbi:MAG: type IX secretion system membrane protein PorP/SprF, partial [Bacteroidota bacterium]
FNSLNAGVKLKLLLDKKKNNIFEAGVSMLHLNNPMRQSVIESQQMGPDSTMMMTGGSRGADARRRRPTLHGHARLDMEMSDKWRFQPTAFFQTSAGTSSLSLQAWGRRHLKDELALRFGLGYRTADAAKVMFGIDAGQIRGALAYDITLSQARNVNSYQGAFELGIAYIFNIYKKPEVKRTILCPDI